MATRDGETLEVILKDFPCHFHWNLEEGFSRDIQGVVPYLDNHLKDHGDLSPVSAKTFRGYLCVSPLNPTGEKDPVAALMWLDRALTDISDTSAGDASDAGNLIVALANKARVLLLMGDTEEAQRVTEQLEGKRGYLECTKANAYINANEAFALSWLGPCKFERATERYQNALNVFSKNEEWLLGLALCFSKLDANFQCLGQEQGALKRETLLRKILQLNHENAFARVHLAKALSDRKADLEATFHYEKALKDGGNDVTTVQRVAEHFLKTDKLDEALDTFVKALKLDPKSAFIHHQIGKAYQQISKKKKGVEKKHFLQKARGYFDQALELQPTRYAAFRDKVYAYAGLNGNQNAREEFRQLLSKANDKLETSDAHLNIATFLERLNKKDDKVKAIQHYKKALAAYPDCRSGQKAAKTLLERKLTEVSANPKNAEALRLIGWIYVEMGHLDSACFYYEKAYEVQKTDFVAFKLAELFNQTNNASKEREYLDSVLYSDDEESEPMKNALYHIENGDQYEEMEESEKARKEYAMAADCRSLKGSEKLLKILKRCNDKEKFKPEWFSDCAKISYNITNKLRLLERKRGGNNSKINARVRQLQKDLDEIVAPEIEAVRDLYGDYMNVFGKVSSDDSCREYSNDIQSSAKQLLRTACAVLHKCVSDFEKCHYHAVSQSRDTSMFFRVTDSDVPAGLRQITEKCGWNDFPKKFGKLFLFLVEIQPGYNAKENGWVLDSELLSNYTHWVGLSRELVGSGTGHGDGALSSKILDLAEEAAVKTANIAREFHKYIDVDDQAKSTEGDTSK